MAYTVIWAFILSTLLFSVLSLPTDLNPEARDSSDDFNPEIDDYVPSDRYLKHDEMITWLKGIARRYPKVARSFSIGQSEQGRELLVLELSHSVGRGKRDLLMPMVKLVCISIFFYYYFLARYQMVRLSNCFRIGRKHSWK